MNAKQNVGPAMIAGAVVILVLLLFGLYHVAFAPKNPIPADAAAEHRNMANFYQSQGHAGQAGH